MLSEQPSQFFIVTAAHWVRKATPRHIVAQPSILPASIHTFQRTYKVPIDRTPNAPRVTRFALRLCYLSRSDTRCHAREEFLHIEQVRVCRLNENLGLSKGDLGKEDEHHQPRQKPEKTYHLSDLLEKSQLHYDKGRKKEFSRPNDE